LEVFDFSSTLFIMIDSAELLLTLISDSFEELKHRREVFLFDSFICVGPMSTGLTPFVFIVNNAYLELFLCILLIAFERACIQVLSTTWVLLIDLLCIICLFAISFISIHFVVSYYVECNKLN